MNGTSTFLASCHEYFVNGERNNGTFRIRPNISIPSFEVNCLFGNESAVTEITPVNLPKSGLVFPKNESVRCLEPNCFTQSVKYHPSLDQIEVIITFKLIIFGIPYSMLLTHFRHLSIYRKIVRKLWSTPVI